MSVSITMKKNVLLLISLMLIISTSVQAKSVIGNQHQQLLLMISNDWQAIQGKLYQYEKKQDKWQLVKGSTSVTLGRTGLAWGLGLHDKQAGQYKKEGDGKAPAGIFTLGDAFGYLPALVTGLTYQAMSKNDYCIDVNGSAYYNQIISSKQFGEDAIKGSSEPMRRDIHLNNDQVYKKGLIINHNSENISGEGSCIFMHVWRSIDKPTAGCTAMEEIHITTILQWLDKSKQPIYVALPKAEYLKLKTDWGLPTVK